VYLLYSHFIKNHPIWIMKDGSLISEVVLSYRFILKSPLRAGSKIRLECSFSF
jgi:hypothetical protein